LFFFWYSVDCFFLTVANTYGSLNDDGVDGNYNNYLVASVNEPAILGGFVSKVSIKFCSLPTSTSPVLWIYIIQYTGIPIFYILRSMYAVPFNQISTTNAIQQYTLPYYQLNISVSEYVGLGFVEQ
jgi:hypothetical protein